VETEDVILEVQSITKVYTTGVVANRDVSFSVERGSIHAIVGENGAGKTTLMNVLFGLERAQGGRLLLNGKEMEVSTPEEAIRLGIGMVHQHFMLAPDLTVAENVVLGHEPRRGLLLDHSRAVQVTEEISAQHGLHVPANAKVKDLPVGVRQRVEILKALFRKADLLILDEPTAVLTPQETDDLFVTLRRLKTNGITIIFISHKLKEVKAIADRVTVMREGRVVVTRTAAGMSEHEMAHLMVGRDISFDRLPAGNAGDSVLSVRHLSVTSADGVPLLNDITLDVHSGEILGIAGVDGNGQSELVSVLAGLSQPSSGNVSLLGSDLTAMSIRDRHKAGLAYVPEDRLRDGVAASSSIEDNLIVDRYDTPPYSGAVLMNYPYIHDKAREYISSLSIAVQDSRASIESLSGGNIQKVVLARELSSKPKVLLVDQPSRGVDVGSMETVHGLIREQRDAGLAILLVSADLDEVLRLASRILVFYGGQITAEFQDVSNLQPSDLGPYMLGAKRQEATV